MTARAFLVTIGFGALSIFSGVAQAQIHVQVGGGNHYSRNPYRNYDHAARNIVTHGAPSPHRSSQYYYYNQRQQYNHYRAQQHRNYDHRAREQNPHHYQPNRSRH